MNLQDFNSSALLRIKLATLQVGTTPRILGDGISACIRIDNSIRNSHLVSGVDYLISSGLKETSIPLFANEVKKKIYLEDITEITPIGADKLLITLNLNGEIYEVYCSAIKYGVIDEVANRPQYWKSFINLSGPDVAIEHLNKYYKHSVYFFVDPLESSSILSIEPYVEKDLIVSPTFSDWPNPSSARNEYYFRSIDNVSININRLNRTISIFDSFERSCPSPIMMEALRPQNGDFICHVPSSLALLNDWNLNCEDGKKREFQFLIVIFHFLTLDTGR